jgi:hypothetical protein
MRILCVEHTYIGISISPSHSCPHSAAQKPLTAMLQIWPSWVVHAKLARNSTEPSARPDHVMCDVSSRNSWGRWLLISGTQSIFLRPWIAPIKLYWVFGIRSDLTTWLHSVYSDVSWQTETVLVIVDWSWNAGTSKGAMVADRLARQVDTWTTLWNFSALEDEPSHRMPGFRAWNLRSWSRSSNVQ